MKKLLLVVAALMFVSSFTYAQSVVQSGTFFYGKDKNEGYTLNSNQGRRTVEYEITFNKPFDKKPKVVVMTTLLDAERSTQVRYNIMAKGVSRDGFVLFAEVWGDTQFNGIGGYWLAHTEE